MYSETCLARSLLHAPRYFSQPFRLIKKVEVAWERSSYHQFANESNLMDIAYVYQLFIIINCVACRKHNANWQVSAVWGQKRRAGHRSMLSCWHTQLSKSGKLNGLNMFDSSWCFDSSGKLWISIKTRNPLRYTIIHQLELRIDTRTWNSHSIHHAPQTITTEGEHAHTSGM